MHRNLPPSGGVGRAIALTLLFATVAASLAFGGIYSLHLLTGAPVDSLTRDPAAVFGAPAHVGFFSQLGLFAWFSAATVCLLGAQVLWTQRKDAAMARFLFFSAAITAVLGVDDAFMLHEHVLPRRGIPELAILAFYGAALVMHLLVHVEQIRRTAYPLLGVALGFLALSAGVDLFEPAVADAYLLEDGAKLAGLISWLAYYWKSTHTALMAHV